MIRKVAEDLRSTIIYVPGIVLMNTLSKEILEDGDQRRKSIGSGGGFAGGKTRRYSIGITSSRKSIGEVGNIVPNYLRASTGSCHDFCKFGKKHEHSKSAVPVKFKTTNVNRDRFTKPVVALEKKKTTLKLSTNPESLTPAEHVKVTKKIVLLPSKKPQVFKQNSATNGKATKNELKTLQQSASLVKTSLVVVNHEGSNVGIKKVDIKTVKKTGVTSKTGGVKGKKGVPKASLNESQSTKTSLSRAAGLNTVKHRGVKQISPLKDQNRMQVTELKQTIDDGVQTKTLHDVEAEPKVKSETMKFDFKRSQMESISYPICNSSESFLGKNVVQEESMITDPVDESEHFSKELLEGSLTAPDVVESLQSCSDKEELEEELLIAPLISESSESFYDDEVLEGESEYTDDEEVKVSEGSETVDVNERKTLDGNHNKIPRKGRMVISEDKDDKAVKLRFRRGKILDIQSETNGPRRLKFRRRVTEGNEDDQNIAIRAYKNRSLDLQTETNGPRKLKFRKGKVMGGNEDKQRIARRNFEKKYVEEKKDSINGPESVVLKHQGEQGKKDAQGLFNNVIEETASKLVESKKSKVKALVGAFETVISLQDGKPSST